jgi:hypothetical protein
MSTADQGVPVDANHVIAMLRDQIGRLSVDVAVQTTRAVQAETEVTRLRAETPESEAGTGV